MKQYYLPGNKEMKKINKYKNNVVNVHEKIVFLFGFLKISQKVNKKKKSLNTWPKKNLSITFFKCLCAQDTPNFHFVVFNTVL